MTSPRVTLTFDNGPTPGITEEVLAILDRAGILSTFFVIGRKLSDAAAQASARRAKAAGHRIGNHTFTHTVTFGDQPDAAFAAHEIGDTQAVIGDLAGVEKLFRPYGKSGRIGPHLFSQAAVAYLLANQFRTVLWNAVPGDWLDPQRWVDTCVAQIKSQDHSIVVLHDIEGGCVTRLPELLDRLGALGVSYEQDFPESVILTRAGQIVSLTPDLIAD